MAGLPLWSTVRILVIRRSTLAKDRAVPRRLTQGFFWGLRAFGCIATLALAACSTLGGGAPNQAAVPSTPALSGETIGAGGVRVALLVPRSATGNGAATALAFRNAAELAMRDFPAAGIQLAV